MHLLYDEGNYLAGVGAIIGAGTTRREEYDAPGWRLSKLEIELANLWR